MRIFLVGFMGCGKSTKAKQLATLLACPLIDVDAELVKQQEMSIAEYFEKHGESEFRQLEKSFLQNYPYPETCVVATGGGLPCFFNNMNWMNEHGITVFLEMTPSQLVSRLQNREKRPLLRGMDDKQLLSFIENKLEERNSYYRKAKLIVDAFDLDADTLLEAIKLQS